MITASERVHVRNKRVALIQQQEDIQATCEGCPFNHSGNSTKCAQSGCQKYQQLRGIGEQLLELSCATKAKYRKQLISQARKYGLTVRIYNALIDYEWTDYFIRKALGMTAKNMVAWKKANGLVRPARTGCRNCDGSGTVQIDLWGMSEICMRCKGTGSSQ